MMDGPSGDGDRLELELLRHVVRTTVHDLGGLSGSLGLQTRVLEQQVTERSIAACGRIAAELRTLGNQLRQIGTRPQVSRLSPSPLASMRQWHALFTRFGEPLLARGVSLRGDVDDADVDPHMAYELVYIAMALLSGLRELPLAPYSELRLATEVTDRAIVVRMCPVGVAYPLSTPVETESAWWAWARRRADAAGIRLHLAAGSMECVMPRP
jgi:hypothetical protein